MNPEAGSLEQLLQYQLEPEIYSLQLLQRFTHAVLASAYDYYPIHLKSWDTGMHRLGLSEGRTISLCAALLQESRAVRVASVFTHLSVARRPQRRCLYPYAALQHILHSQKANRSTWPLLLHALNTAGSLRFPQWAGNMVRLGIGLYGINPIAEVKDFGLGWWRATHPCKYALYLLVLLLGMGVKE